MDSENISDKTFCMGTKHETTACSPDDFRRISMQLEYFSKRYRDLIRQMEDNNVFAAHVTGVKTLDRAIEYLQGSVTSATAAVDDAVLKSATCEKHANPVVDRATAEGLEAIQAEETPARAKKARKTAKK